MESLTRADIPARRDELATEARTILDRSSGTLATEDQTRYDEIMGELETLKTRDEQLARIEGFAAAGGMERVGYGRTADGTLQRKQWHDGRHTTRREPAPDEIAPLLPSPGHVSELLNASRETRNLRITTRDVEPEQTRATVTLTDTGTPATPLSASQRRQPRRLATTAGLGVERVQGTPDVVYPVFGAGAADVAAEGATKTEYDGITPGSATPQVIAAWTDFSAQSTWTMPGFEQRLSNKLSRLIAVREDQLLVSTVLGTSGIQAYTGGTGESYADSLLGAAGMVLGSDVSADPDVGVVHPDDVVGIFGGSYGTSGETPEQALRLMLHGMSIYVSSAITAGTALVGAWSASSKFVDGRNGVTFLVDAMTGLKSNTITLLAEEAVNVAVDEPEGFVQVTFDTGA